VLKKAGSMIKVPGMLGMPTKKKREKDLGAEIMQP